MLTICIFESVQDLGGNTGKNPFGDNIPAKYKLIKEKQRTFNLDNGLRFVVRDAPKDQNCTTSMPGCTSVARRMLSSATSPSSSLFLVALSGAGSSTRWPILSRFLLERNWVEFTSLEVGLSLKETLW